MSVPFNRLAKEKSPYLLQHAHNPVDWYPWGDEAFQKAKKEDKPILLSVGYSTCHWCHVMETESFEDSKTAEIMNDHFVSIKVDREERPDIDSVYMNYVMATTGSGGWPMNVFLTPERKPFYGGTYFPPQDGYGRPGFKTLLLSVADSWKNRRNEILESSESAVSFLNAQGGRDDSPDRPSIDLGKETMEMAYQKFEENFDREHGGFGHAPKFPRPHALSMILRHWDPMKITDNALPGCIVVEKTLTEMARGGIYDQLGGGFHRYSVDNRWRIPHYEKMLYDQALLVRTYLEAYQIGKNEAYERIVRETLDYVLERMTSPEGGFFSAEDADSADPRDPSKKVEGAYYVWKKEEIEKILTKEEAVLFFSYYGVDEVLFVNPNGEAGQVPPPRQIRQKLLEIRNQRPRPHLDDKILTDWNGLMINAFAFASRVLNEPRYARAASAAAKFISQKLDGGSSTLFHRYRDGESAITCNLNDYAFLIYGYLELYQATFDEKWLTESKRLAGEMLSEFWDPEGGGFFLTANGAQPLITRPKELYDGALPSGNSIAILDLVLLNYFTQDETYQKKAEEAIKAFSPKVAQDPTSYPQFLIALDAWMGPFREIVLAALTPEDSVVKKMLAELYSEYRPKQIVRFDAARAVDGKTTAFFCQNRVCKLPVHTAVELKKLLMENK